MSPPLTRPTSYFPPILPLPSFTFFLFHSGTMDRIHRRLSSPNISSSGFTGLSLPMIAGVSRCPSSSCAWWSGRSARWAQREGLATGLQATQSKPVGQTRHPKQLRSNPAETSFHIAIDLRNQHQHPTPDLIGHTHQPIPQHESKCF